MVAVVSGLSTEPDIYQVPPKSLSGGVICNKVCREDIKVTTYELI